MDVKNVPNTNGFDYSPGPVQSRATHTVFSSTKNARPSDRLKNAGPGEAPSTPPHPGNLQINMTDIPRNTGNRIDGPEGTAGENNRVSVNGAGNAIDLRGGPDIHNTDITVTGDRNTVRFKGGRQTDDTVVVNGNNNEVNVGGGVGKLNVNVAGDNVKIDVAENDPLARGTEGVTVNVDADWVLVNIDRNGRVEVKGYGGNEDFLVDFNNENKTLNVARYEYGDTLVERIKDSFSPKIKAELPKPDNKMNDMAGLPQATMEDVTETVQENPAA